MRTAHPRRLPVGLESTRRRFEQWRRTRQCRSRIPERLWAAAVKAVGRYGLYPTARALGLDYYSLKKRAEATHRRLVPQKQSAATFVELAAPVPAGFPESILELEHPGGAKMRVHLKGVPVPDLTVLSRSFWSMER